MGDIDGLEPGARVVVAMSGGVDSSVVAAVMAAQGFEVVGVTLQLYDHGNATGRKGACCAGQDIHDARQVAERLGIAHYVLDFEERFRRAVIDDFADTYAAGRTPIPCVRCNQRVKFRDLLDIARDLGAAALATGHYARRIEGASGVELHRGADPGRDQSYFLFATTQQQLDFLRFPLGSLVKDETRAVAARYGLPVAEKPDSQDICFVPHGDHARTVAALRPDAAQPGEIVDVSGKPLGRHEGIARFTVGQRRKLGVSAGERLYVVGIDAGRHRIMVGPRRAALCGEAWLADMNWLDAGAPPAAGLAVEVQHRYNEPPTAAHVEPAGDGRMKVRFATPQVGVAPGQACVVYAGTRLLGGGWIDRAPLLQAPDEEAGAA
ncbi:tRNA 2-thiouridine(34) synthase MnmA [Geminicoccaceae bacterium 1502E]|nr:tRNA 2-thiouridine(34) synthase MnmA [Geminicoccaceae bacterium 1502E]